MWLILGTFAVSCIRLKQFNVVDYSINIEPVQLFVAATVDCFYFTDSNILTVTSTVALGTSFGGDACGSALLWHERSSSFICPKLPVQR